MKKKKAFAGAILAAALLLYFSTTAVAQSAVKLTDAEIASAAVTANQSDIDFAKIAQQKSKNADVLQLAATMAKDHQSVIDQAVALVTKLNVTPKDNAFSKKLRTDAAATAKMLRGKSGAAFDKAYVDNEVAYHRAVIAAVENVLILQADNGELKSLLQTVAPVLQAHLEHAEMIQKKMSGK